MNQLLVTGAAGKLGQILRSGLAGFAKRLRLSDIVEMAPAGLGEEVVTCDLQDRGAVAALAEGCNGIAHLGAISSEAPFDNLLPANIAGTYNVYEAARLAGCRRILFASSSHVTGFHLQTSRLDHMAPIRPDTLYAVSKCFGEGLSRYYFDKFGLESVCVRIGNCSPKPRVQRHLATWLSPRDFVGLAKAVFAAPSTGHTIVYGVSDNKAAWWSNDHASFLGWKPIDNSDAFRETIEASAPLQEPSLLFQGGDFTRRERR